MDNKVFELNWTELNDSDGTQNIPRPFDHLMPAPDKERLDNIQVTVIHPE